MAEAPSRTKRNSTFQGLAAHPAGAGASSKARRSSVGVYADTVSAPPEVAKRYRTMAYFRFGFILFMLFLIILTLIDVIPVMSGMSDMVDRLRDMGGGGGFLYFVFCAIFALLCVPSSLLSLLGGYIFESTGVGVACAFPGVMLGACVAFFAGRFLYKDWLESELRHVLIFASLSQATADHGYKVVFLARLSPIPFGVLNYVFSISAIKIEQFVASSAAGLVIICVLYAKVGAEFSKYFKDKGFKNEIDNCAQAVNHCYASHSCQEAGSANATCASVEAMDACSDSASCTVMFDTACMQAAPEFIEGVGSCDFAEIESKALDLGCAYNDCEDSKAPTAGGLTLNDECHDTKVMRLYVEEESDVSNTDCLQELNGSVTWAKIVLPIALFFTMVFIAFFGARAMHKAGYLQLAYNLDRQKELLLAEQETADKEKEKEANPVAGNAV